MSPPRSPEKVAADFWARVSPEPNTGCWLWTGAAHPSGYGHVSAFGRTWQAHRLAWFLTHGEDPAGLYLCHRCDCPPCVNPAHLFPGTASDNAWDKIAKGRDIPLHLHIRGTQVNTAKMSEGDVRELRRLAAAGIPYAELGRRFGVSEVAARLAALGKTWRHVDVP